jgi:cytoskeletal protein CcmA (bactofilin family)
VFGRKHEDTPAETAKDIGLLGIDTRFEGSIRFAGTLRIDGAVVGNITSEPGSGSVLIVNQQATVQGDIVSDSVLISGHVEGTVRARGHVEIFRSGVLKGDVHTSGLMIEGGAEFQGHCHMANGQLAPDPAAARPSRAGPPGPARAATKAAQQGSPDEVTTAEDGTGA